MFDHDVLPPPMRMAACCSKHDAPYGSTLCNLAHSGFRDGRAV